MRHLLLAALSLVFSLDTLTAAEPVRGVSGDLWADVILGKPDFSEISPNEVVPYKVFNPGGVLVDRSVSPGRAYVWDSGNSRILGIDLATCYAGASPCSAQIVLGQPSGFDHSACNGDSGFQRYPVRASASADTLCGIPEVTLSPLEWKSFVTMASDAQGNLYVPDAFNNRVLKYISPFTTDRTADEVWGQADFSGNQCNRGGSPTASTLCFTTDTFSAGGAALDASGNLWVADRGNNRVLRFSRNPATGVIAKTADLVLGQPDFVSNGAGLGLARMQAPAAVRFGPDGRLYVADSENHRVLTFTPNPVFTTGMAASSPVSSWPFAAPYGLEADPAGEGLWVTDSANNMLVLWNWDGTAVLKVLGKDTFQADGQCQNWGAVANLCNFGGGVGIDTQGNVLPSVFTWNQDVPRFPAPIPSPQPGVVIQPDKRLFNPPDGYNLRGGKGIRSGSGVAIYKDQLLVADAGRVVFWNGLGTLTNGKPFDGYVGDPNFSYWFNCCGYLKTDSANRLWVHDYGAGVHVYALPLTTGATALANILPPGTSIPVLAGGSLTIDRIDGIVPAPAGDFLWISDAFNNRVLRIRNPLTSPVVDVVLGQTSPSGTLCNRGIIPPPNSGTILVASADMICHPGALSFDRQGNLFVSDHGPEVEGNWRLLRFAGGLFPPTITAPLYAVPATKIFPYRGLQPGITFEPAFDSANQMVVGYNPYLGGRFVGVYKNPAGPSTDPDFYLNDFSSWPAGIAFDANDNLYVGDNNRGRLLVYRKSLGADLVVTSLIAPLTAVAGTTIQVGDVTANLSGGADPTTTRFYLSLNATWDASDTPIGSRPVGPLSAGDFEGGSAGVVIPAGKPTGNYYLIARANADGSTPETNTANNTRSVAIRISPPDLYVSALSVPAAGGVGVPIVAACTTRNQSGAGPVPFSTTKFYLSKNTTLDASDPEIGSQPITDLGGGSLANTWTTLAIPEGTSPGSFYVIAKADGDNSVPESNEVNNAIFDTIVIGPDLVVSALSVPATGGAGLPITVTSTIKNQGGGPAAGTIAKFYLSANSSYGAGDVFLDSRQVDPIAPGGSKQGSTVLTIPAGTPIGTYYILAVADSGNAVAELNETNNTGFAIVRLSPDLVVSALSVPVSAAIGSKITVTDTTRNQGQGTAGATKTSFYLSRDSVWDPADVFLASRDVPVLATATSSAGSTPITIPPAAPGTYYLLARADAESAVAESGESNNTANRAIKITN